MGSQHANRWQAYRGDRCGIYWRTTGLSDSAQADAIIHFARSPQWILWAPMRTRQGRVLTALLRGRQGLHGFLYRRVFLRASDILADITTTPSWRRNVVQWFARVSLRAQIRDRQLRAALTRLVEERIPPAAS